MKLEQKIFDALTDSAQSSLSDWELANVIYNGCMSSPKAGNGVKIANIRRVVNASERLSSFIDQSSSFCVFIKN